MHTLLYASSTRTSTNVNASSSGGRHIEASQAHCIALHPTSRGCGGLPALCPVPAPTGCNHKCCECNIAEARASTKTYNMATPRVEASHSLSRPERHGGEDASSSAPHCSLEAASHLLLPPLAAIRGHGPTSHDRPLVSPSCLAQIVKHPIDDVRDSAVRRSLQGWSATARGTYICSAGTARRRSALLLQLWLAARVVAPSQSYSAASPPR